MKEKKESPATSTSSDIVVRLKLESGNQDCPRYIRELMKDAVDAIKSLRERVRFLEKMDADRLSKRLHSVRNNPQDHEGIDGQ